MKKYSLLTLLLVVTLQVTACNYIARNTSTEVPMLQTDTPATTHLPELPAKLDFAGERVPLEYYDVTESLERELTVSMYMHSRTLQTLQASGRYFPIIEPILAKYGLPDDFKYLAMAESSLNPNAYSSAKAAGLWQFLASSAGEYGLEVNEYIDERYHTEKATVAACKYLKGRYATFGNNWTLAAASYNAGPTGVLRRQNSQDESSYYDTFLPEETMRYVFRILSFKLIMANPSAYGFDVSEADYFHPHTKTKEVEISSTNIKWPDVAKKYGTNYKLLRQLNPWIRTYDFPNKAGKTYTITVPTEGFRTDGRR